jgi:hypothetical protein
MKLIQPRCRFSTHRTGFNNQVDCNLRQIGHEARQLTETHTHTHRPIFYALFFKCRISQQVICFAKSILFNHSDSLQRECLKLPELKEAELNEVSVLLIKDTTSSLAKVNVKQDRQCRHKSNIEARSCNHWCSEKAVSIIYSECVFVVLGIQHAMSTRYLSSVACPALRYFSTLSHKWYNLKKKVIEHEMCVLIFFMFVWNISHSNENWVRYDKKCILVFA